MKQKGFWVEYSLLRVLPLVLAAYVAFLNLLPAFQLVTDGLMSETATPQKIFNVVFCSLEPLVLQPLKLILLAALMLILPLSRKQGLRRGLPIAAGCAVSLEALYLLFVLAAYGSGAFDGGRTEAVVPSVLISYTLFILANIAFAANLFIAAKKGRCLKTLWLVSVLAFAAASICLYGADTAALRNVRYALNVLLLIVPQLCIVYVSQLTCHRYVRE